MTELIPLVMGLTITVPFWAQAKPSNNVTNSFFMKNMALGLWSRKFRLNEISRMTVLRADFS